MAQSLMYLLSETSSNPSHLMFAFDLITMSRDKEFHKPEGLYFEVCVSLS